MLAVKIIMKKRQEQGLARGLSEDELRRQVLKEMKSDVQQKMDKMIENLKRYRREFGGSRVPTFLVNKDKQEERKRQLLQLQSSASAADLRLPHQLLKSTSMGNLDDKNEDGSTGSVIKGADIEALESARRSPTKDYADGALESHRREGSLTKSLNEFAHVDPAYRAVSTRNKSRHQKGEDRSEGYQGTRVIRIDRKARMQRQSSTNLLFGRYRTGPRTGSAARWQANPQGNPATKPRGKSALKLGKEYNTEAPHGPGLAFTSLYR